MSSPDPETPFERRSASPLPERPEPSIDDDVELPPLDDAGSDGGDEPREDDDFGDEVAALEDDGPDPLDDASASELEVGAEVDDAEEPSGGDEAADDAVDVGALDEGLVADEEPAAADASEAADDEEDELDDFDAGDDDGGVEGTDDPIEDEVDEQALPALDADEAGDFEEEDDLAAGGVGEGDEPLPAWAAVRWVVREGAGAPVPCRAVAARDGRVAAGGDVVLAVDAEARAAHRAAVDGGAVAVAIDGGGALLVVTGRGAVVEVDAARGATNVGALRGQRERVELATTPARAWALADGALWSLAGAPRALTPARERGVRAIAASGATLFALVDGERGPAVERLRSDDEGWLVAPLDAVARAVADGSDPHLAAAGRAIAVADGAKGLAVSRDGGASYRRLDFAGVAAIAFAGDDERAPLLALVVREVDDSAYLVEIPAHGAPATLAAVPAPRGDDADEPFGPAALAWDATREVAWIACRAGLLALGRAPRH